MPHKKSKIELYDVAADPSEKTNIAKKHPDVVERLTKKLTDIVCQGRTTNGEPQPNDTGHWADLTWISSQKFDELALRP